MNVREACEACLPAHQHDCSGFARALASELGVALTGLANQIVDTLRAGGAWRQLPDGPAAQASVAAGNLVLAGLRGDEQVRPDEHGHVVVVVDGPLNRGRYPSAYWGSLGGQPGRFQTINWAWNEQDRDRVTYAERRLTAAA